MKVKLKVNKKVYSSILALSIGFGEFAVDGEAIHAQDTKVQFNEEYQTPSYIIDNWETPDEMNTQEIVLSYLQEKLGEVNGNFKIIKAEEDEQTETYHFKLQKLYNGIPVYGDRKSTRLNSSHVSISYAVFCLKKKMIQKVKM